MNRPDSRTRWRDGRYVQRVAEQYERGFPGLDRRALELTLALNACFTKMNGGHAQAAYDNGLERTIGRLALLRLLYFAGGDSMTQAEISKQLRVTPASVTSMVTGLEREGLIERVQSEDDRRTIRVTLTLEGRDVSERLLPLMPEVSARLWSVLTSEEQEIFLRLMFKFLDR